MRCRWPDGHDCAVAFAFDVDAESALIFREPERAARSLALNEERRFGVRTGVARILRLLERYGLRGTFYVPGWMVAHHTATIRPIRDAGHELAAHGNVHESLDTLDANEEVRVLEEQLDIWKACLDLRPSGYRSPSWELNAGTPAVLKWAQEFDGMRRENGCFVLTMHAWISSRAGRLLGLEQLIQHMRRLPGVWLATVAEIAAWATTQSESALIDPARGTVRP